MIKKTINFVDYNGVAQSKQYYFHLTATDVIKMTAKYGMDLIPYFEKILEEEDHMKIVETFEDLILSAVGIRTKDGANFVKNRQIREDFEYSQAYAELFVELMTNPDSAKEFMTNLVATQDGAKPVQPVTESVETPAADELAALRARIAQLEN